MKPVNKHSALLFEHDANERLIGEIPRHPIGYFFILLSGVIATVAVLIAVYMATRYQGEFTESLGILETTDLSGLVSVVGSVLMIMIVISTALGLFVYRGNYIILTSDKLVLVYAKNIIARRISQLSIGDVQDVTIDQNTLLSRLFKYGTINIETAGEQAHFTFPYAQYPYEAAKSIVATHEENLKLYGN